MASSHVVTWHTIYEDWPCSRNTRVAEWLLAHEGERAGQDRFRPSHNAIPAEQSNLYRRTAGGALIQVRPRTPSAEPLDDNRNTHTLGDRRRSPRRRRCFLITGLGLGLAIVAFLTASSLLFVWPATDQPQHVGAILSLDGGNESARESRAISLAERGYAHVLLFSQGNSHTTPCPKVRGISVVCFAAEPGRTAGEVKFAALYARRHGLRSLMIVPGRAQVTRARLLMKRCYSGHVTVVAAPVKLEQIPYDVIYEWGALAKALLIDRTC
jgi:hypothetical protein